MKDEKIRRVDADAPKRKRSFNLRDDTIQALDDLRQYYGCSDRTAMLTQLIHTEDRRVAADVFAGGGSGLLWLRSLIEDSVARSLEEKSKPTKKVKEHSAVTKRRLKEGERGESVQFKDLKALSLEVLQKNYSTLCDSIVALQSLDDLGSPEENRRAWDQMIKLKGRGDIIQKEIESRGAEAKWC